MTARAWTDYTQHAVALAAEGARLRKEQAQIRQSAEQQRQDVDAEVQAVAAWGAEALALADRLDADAVALAERVEAGHALSLGRRTGGPQVTDTSLLDASTADLRAALQALRAEVEAEQARRATSSRSLHPHVRIAIVVILALVLLQLISSLT